MEGDRVPNPITSFREAGLSHDIVHHIERLGFRVNYFHQFASFSLLTLFPSSYPLSLLPHPVYVNLCNSFRNLHLSKCSPFLASLVGAMWWVWQKRVPGKRCVTSSQCLCFCVGNLLQDQVTTYISLFSILFPHLPFSPSLLYLLYFSFVSNVFK